MLCEEISLFKDIPLKRVLEYNRMDFRLAIRRFFKKDVRNKLIEEGKYFVNPQNDDERLINANFSLNISDYKKEFYLTEGGRWWYESQSLEGSEDVDCRKGLKGGRV